MAESNPNARLEAFCDGVFAIALTLLIIDIKLPASVTIDDDRQFWLALRDMVPSMLSFLLSFLIIFNTWVNHHASMKLVDKTSGLYVWATAILLLSVVLFPFPTALVGQYLFTAHAAPAVVLYDFVMTLQAIGWIAMTATVLRGGLARDEAALAATRKNARNSIFAFLLYSALTILAFWFPLPAAAISTLSWIFWFIFGLGLIGGPRAASAAPSGA
jgi:uncharacterized membrane protein